MLEVGQKYRIYRRDALMQNEMRWVNAVVTYIPENKCYVQMRIHFINNFGEHTSYTESFVMNELDQMIRAGEVEER